MLLQTPEKPATKTVHVEVTLGDIERGCPRKASQCPLAHAITRAMGQPMAVDCFSEGWIAFGHGLLRMSLPQRAVIFADAFDLEQGVSPFSFDLELPE